MKQSDGIANDAREDIPRSVARSYAERRIGGNRLRSNRKHYVERVRVFRGGIAPAHRSTMDIKVLFARRS